MKLAVCEFPDEFHRKGAAWAVLVAHVANTRPDIVVLPEMPFCRWIFSTETVDLALWREALAQHDVMIGRLGELACGWVLASRPVEENGQRYNEAFLWSHRSGFRAVRRKWYLPDAPTARETTWFSQGDRNFSPVKADTLVAGFQLCSEMMFPEHAREIGFSDAHLIAQPRASGSGRHWRVASEMSAVASGCYVASANRRSAERDWFSGGSWVLSPNASVLAETTAENPFVTVEIDLATAERAKTHYPRDLQRMYREPAQPSGARS
jgi:N-carbamoylputrescine amidase